MSWNKLTREEKRVVVAEVENLAVVMAETMNEVWCCSDTCADRGLDGRRDYRFFEDCEERGWDDLNG